MKTPCASCNGRGWHWTQGSGPSCVHAGPSDLCDGCADFLVRILPVITVSDRKQRQEDVALMLSYTSRHVRRLCANLGYHSWSEFYSAVRQGALVSQHDADDSPNVVQIRRPA